MLLKSCLLNGEFHAQAVFGRQFDDSRLARRLRLWAASAPSAIAYQTDAAWEGRRAGIEL
jgi:hypothetical protein